MSTDASIRVGLIVPPANPTVEPEVHRLLPEGVVAYVSRLGASPGLDLATRLVHYRDDCITAASGLRGLHVEAALVACTGSSYPLDRAGDLAWSDAISGSLGAPVVTAAGALCAVLGAMNARRVSIISPYPDWLTAQCRQFWQRAGFSVEAVWPVVGDGSIYDLTAQDVRNVVVEVIDEASGVDAVIVCGTGAPSIAALDEVGASSPIPVVSSNVAGAWSLLHAAGAGRLIGDSASGALRRLADLPAPESVTRA